MAILKSKQLTGKKLPVLISTISPVSGGVPTMTKFIVDCLRSRGFDVVLAHYEPYSVTPSLSVPILKCFAASPKAEVRVAMDDCETHAIGAWFPELEFTHYLSTEYWKKLLHRCGAYLAVAGNVLPATVYWQNKCTYLAWVATGWDADRKDRVAAFPLLRKVVDQNFNSHILRRFEKKILQNGVALALSHYTKNTLDNLSKEVVCHDVLPMPVDTDWYYPKSQNVVKGRIGFVGRINDPRKNIPLFLQSIQILVEQGLSVTSILIGDEPSDEQQAYIQSNGLTEHVAFRPYLDKQALRDELQQLDVLLVTSHQEGLCIAALEAMACGCPVVTTRCGGPEEFVVDDTTGYTVAFNAEEITNRIQSIFLNRSLRDLLSKGAREMILDNYSEAAAEKIFWRSFFHCFPHYE